MEWASDPSIIVDLKSSYSSFSLSLVLEDTQRCGDPHSWCLRTTIATTIAP